MKTTSPSPSTAGAALDGAPRFDTRLRAIAARLRGGGGRARLGGPVTALIVLAIGFQLCSGTFLTMGNIRSVIEAASVPAIIAAGLSFVLIMGAIDLSVEGVVAAVSMVAALLVANGVNDNHFGLAGILLALLVGLVFGVFNGVLNAVFRMPSLIVTLGSWFIGLGVAAVLFPQRVPQIRDPVLLGVSHLHVAGFSLIVFIALLLVIGAELIQRYTQPGRMIYAIGGEEGLLLASGQRIGRIKIVAFALSGLFSGIAGVLLSAQLGSGNANIGDGHLFPAISASVLGGTVLTGGRGGAVQSAIGVLILEVLSNGLIQIGAGPYTRNIISGAVILCAVAAGGWHRRRLLRVVK